MNHNPGHVDVIRKWKGMNLRADMTDTDREQVFMIPNRDQNQRGTNPNQEAAATNQEQIDTTHDLQRQKNEISHDLNQDHHPERTSKLYNQPWKTFPTIRKMNQKFLINHPTHDLKHRHPNHPRRGRRSKHPNQY